MADMAELRFEMGDAGARELRPVIDAAFREGIADFQNRKHPEATDRAPVAGVVDLSSVEPPPPIDLREAEISVEESDQGVSAELTEIVIHVVGDLTAATLIAIFNETVLPALKTKFGARAIGRHVAGGGGRVRSEHPER